MENTSPTLSEIFEPIRDDLARVDTEFVRHVQSKVELIPRIGKVHPVQRRQAHPARGPADGRQAAAATPGTAPCSMPPWSSSSTRPRSSTTTSSTMRSCGGAGWRCTRSGATTSRSCSATTCTSSRWRSR
ncbi:MAG: hypothetical protein MZV64_73605 [Ignavibacteriales bacterium]|nr:hypothetical protein [Ignavibacteriales bacterium]